MQVLILRDTVADGRKVAAGQVHDLPDAEARLLLRMGRAATMAAPEPAPAAPQLDTEQAAAVVAEVKKKPGRPRRAA